MFNHGRFNLQRFNVVNDSAYNDIYIKESMVETFDSLISYAENLFHESYTIITAYSKSFATPGFLSDFRAEAEFDAEIESVVNFGFVTELLEILEGFFYLSDDEHLDEYHQENIESNVYVSNDMLFDASANAVMLCGVFFSANFIIPSFDASEIFDSSISSAAFNYLYINVDVTIPAGGVLIIDSDNFNVLLNGQNAIDKQRGDWLDELARNTFDISITSAGASSLVGSILYTERYL